MAAIASGKGRKPKPFILKGAQYQSDAVWQSDARAANGRRSCRSAEAELPSREFGCIDTAWQTCGFCAAWIARPNTC